MHVVEEVVGLEPMLRHEPPHGRPVAAVVILLPAKRPVVPHVEKTRPRSANTLVDLLPEIEVMRIERIVEIEDPARDVGKAARYRARHRHGARKRTVAGAWSASPTFAKPVGVSPFAMQSLCSATSNLASRVHRTVSPPHTH